MKKLLAMLLALIMVFTMLPMSAMATETTKVPGDPFSVEEVTLDITIPPMRREVWVDDTISITDGEDVKHATISYNDYRVYRFIPDVSGKYDIYTPTGNVVTDLEGNRVFNNFTIGVADESGNLIDQVHYNNEVDSSGRAWSGVYVNLNPNTYYYIYVYNFVNTPNSVIDSFIHLELNTRNPFPDVLATDYYFDPIILAVRNGITEGLPDGTFAPHGVCTRGQIVTFLWRAAGKPQPQSRVNPFTDVHQSDFFYQAVLWAVEEGITKGLSMYEFGPNEGCTRGQVVTFLYRFYNSPPLATLNNPFMDVDKLDFYYDAVLWAVDREVTTGTGFRQFSPNDFCTRAQIVTFIYRAIQQQGRP